MPIPPELTSSDGSKNAAIFGANGGIGAAVARQIECRNEVYRLVKFARQPVAGMQQCDITDTKSIDGAIDILRAMAPLQLCIIATGQLSNTHTGPEKSNAALSMDEMMAQFAVNSAGPALLMAKLAPLLDCTRKSIIGVLSARVGSISDNRLGGWHSYRASKAALNMLVKTISIELARKNKMAVCVGLHPGTVATRLSQPFQKNVSPAKLFAPDMAATKLLAVLDGLSAQDTGRCFDYSGQEINP